MINVSEEIFNYKNSFQKKYNLKLLLSSINDPQNNFPVINVVGTNGKGSVTNYLSHGLQNKYERVGMFISPAFIYHNERIQINNEPIGDDDLKRILKESKSEIEKFELTFFEIWTLVAIKYFREQHVEVAVIEAGIGGRLDSTNVFENQLAVAITSIGFDHTEILGDTIEEIIFQKVGIAKPNSKVFIANDNEQHKTIFEKLLINNEINFTEKDSSVDGYQKINLGLAKTILNKLNVDTKGLMNVVPLLGRFTKLKENPLLIIDGCHNVDGINKMISSAKELNKNFSILFATSNQKNSDEMLEVLNENFKKVFVTEFDHFKSWKIPENFSGEKISDWKEFITNNKEDLIICGSLYFIPLVYEFIKEV